MTKLEFDIEGKFKLIDDTLFSKGIPSEHWGHCNLVGSNRQDSHLLKLLNDTPLFIGENCEAKLRFKFRDHDNFGLLVRIGDIIELNIGSLKYGELIVEEILNPSLISK